MRRTFKRGTKARLSFSSGLHAVNMAESTENAGSWTVSGSKETMEVPEELQRICENYATTTGIVPASSRDSPGSDMALRKLS